MSKIRQLNERFVRDSTVKLGKAIAIVNLAGQWKNFALRSTQYIGGLIGALALFWMEFLLFMIPQRATPGRDQIPVGELLLALGLNLILAFLLIRKRWTWVFRGAFMSFLILICFVFVFLAAGLL